MLKIKITAEIESVPFPRPFTNDKRRYNPKRYTDFKNALGLIKGAFKINADFYKKSRYKDGRYKNFFCRYREKIEWKTAR